MYADFLPGPNVQVEQVLLFERKDLHYYTIDEIVGKARDVGSSYVDGDGDEIFCIVFLFNRYGEPARIEQFSERLLRQELERRFRDFGDVREIDGICHSADADD